MAFGDPVKLRVEYDQKRIFAALRAARSRSDGGNVAPPIASQTAKDILSAGAGQALVQRRVAQAKRLGAQLKGSARQGRHRYEQLDKDKIFHISFIFIQRTF